MFYLNLDPTWKPRFLSKDRFLSVKTLNFPAGETHVKIGEPLGTGEVTICHRIRTGDHQMQMFLAADAARNMNPDVKLTAYLPYLPNARQDRLMVSGEPFSLKVFIKLLAASGYTQLYVLDPHNAEVTGALCAAYGIQFHEVTDRLLQEAVEGERKLDTARQGIDYVLVSPDAGASKKITKQAATIHYEGTIFQGEKKRDLASGRIERYEVYGPVEELPGKTAIIRDDICSKGGTFKLLAAALKAKGAAKVVLVVSHWEDTATRSELLEAGIDRIYTTNSLGDVSTTASGPATGDGRAWHANFLTQFGA